MPPHERMSLTQQLLIRALIAAFWREPYKERLVDWGTTLHDRFMLPHYCWQDFCDVLGELAARGTKMEASWFLPHFEFRFPHIGEFTRGDVHVQLREAIEPWYVLGEEPGGGGTVRFVDSSLERVQICVNGLIENRHAICATECECRCMRRGWLSSLWPVCDIALGSRQTVCNRRLACILR